MAKPSFQRRVTDIRGLIPVRSTEAIKKFTTAGTQSKETNTTTSSNPSSLKLTPTSTQGTLNGLFYDVQANCTNVAPGPPAGTYIKGTQQLDVIVGPTNYPKIRVNSIDMEPSDVTVTCTFNCH
jgi:hypothetical protein